MIMRRDDETPCVLNIVIFLFVVVFFLLHLSATSYNYLRLAMPMIPSPYTALIHTIALRCVKPTNTIPSLNFIVLPRGVKSFDLGAKLKNFWRNNFSRQRDFEVATHERT